MKIETQEIGTVLTTMISRIDSFYSYEDLNQFYDPSKSKYVALTEILHSRNEWYKNAFNSILQNHQESEKGKSILETIRLRIDTTRKMNKKYLFESAMQLSTEDKKLMHSHLKFLEEYLYKLIYSQTVIGQKKEVIETVSLRGKTYPVFSIAQKTLLIKYLEKNNLFPSRNYSSTHDKYIICLAVLFGKSGTNISKHIKSVEDDLKGFNKKAKETGESLDDYSRQLHKDVTVVKAWLLEMGLDKIATKIDDELLA
jgi:hypothetical protein